MYFETYDDDTKKASEDSITIIIIASVGGVVFLGLVVLCCVCCFVRKRRLTIAQENRSRRNNAILENQDNEGMGLHVANLPGQNVNYNNLSYSNNPYQGQPQGYGIENQGYNYPSQFKLSKGGSSFSMKNGPNRDYGYHFKKMKYSEGANRFDHDKCMVCLCEFEKREEIRKILACRHIFHQECLDMWLNKDRSCPFCKQDLRWEAIENKKYDAKDFSKF
jgi:hypothetical protein